MGDDFHVYGHILTAACRTKKNSFTIFFTMEPFYSDDFIGASILLKSMTKFRKKNPRVNFSESKLITHRLNNYEEQSVYFWDLNLMNEALR